MVEQTTLVPAVAAPTLPLLLVNGRAGRLLSTAVTDATTGNYYISFLMQTGVNNQTGYRAFELHQGSFADDIGC